MRSFSYYGERGNLNDQELANVSTNDFRDVYEENRTVKYLYDANGNQFADFNKDIAWIKYNLLNLPQTIQFANGNKTEYMYDAAGIKQSARWSYSTTEANIQLGDVTNENNSIGTTSTTDYCGAYVYEQGKLRRILTPEGYVSANGVITPNAIAYWQHVYLLKDHLGNTRKTMRSNFLSSTSVTLTDFSQAIDYYPFGMEITKVDNADSERYCSYMGGGAIPYLYNGKEMDRMHGLNSYDHGARWRDGVIPAWPAVDPLAENYYSFSPYVYCGNNPVNAVDPDGMEIKLASEVVDGKTIITVTVTGKLINESGKAYTTEEMQAYTNRLVSSISSAYTGSDGDVSWKGVANITLVSDDNPLGATDHAFRIVDQGKIPGAKGEDGVLGMAPFGENVVYLSNHMLDRTQATEGTYSGTGKTDAGTGTLERTGPHELGHSGNLKHPTPGTMDGNLMHQTKQSNAGMKLTKDQILQMQKDYDAGKLNQGKQKVE